MWTPQLAPAEFPWGEIQAQYPAAYAALFALKPDTLHLYPAGPAPHQFEQRREVPEGETEEFAQLAHPADMVLFARDFRLRDLYEFFDGYGLYISVQPHAMNTAGWSYHPFGPTEQAHPDMGGWSYSIATGGSVGRMRSRHDAETMAFMLAFAALENRLKLSYYVEASTSGPAV